MYLFARSRLINQAKARAAVAAGIEAGSRASQIIGFPVYVWAAVLGPDRGTVAWTARIEHLADAIAADDAIMADEAFAEWLEANDGLFAGPTTDVISEVVYGAPKGEPKAYVEVARAVCANGAFAEAMGLGVEISETASRVTGHEGMFLTPVVGAYASVGWVTGYDDLGQLEAANAALAASDEWVKLVDRAGHAFQPGVPTSLLRRLA